MNIYIQGVPKYGQQIKESHRGYKGIKMMNNNIDHGIGNTYQYKNTGCSVLIQIVFTAINQCLLKTIRIDYECF